MPKNSANLSPAAKRYARHLRAAGGIVAECAKRMGVSRAAVTKMVRKYPELQTIKEEARQELVDNAESGLRKRVRDGCIQAIKIVLLNTAEGRARGYSSRHELSIEGESLIRLIHAPPQAETVEQWQERALSDRETLDRQHSTNGSLFR